MAGSQKFSLRLPSRKSKTSSNVRSTDTQPDYQTSSVPPPIAQRKADKVLGTSPSLRKLSGKPSLRSIAHSDVASEAPVPSIAQGHRLQPRPSSPLLGDKFAATSAASMRDRSIREYGSSSTLHSYYDAQKSPLAVSQQTSESSARDYALRKGQPTVVLPGQRPHEPIAEEPSMSKSDTVHSRDGKRRPNHIDLSMLFPKARSTSASMLSPRRYTNSPSPLSTTASDAHSTVTSPSTPGSSHRLSKTPRAKDVQRTQSQRRNSTAPDPHLAKVNVRRPKPGIENWFDALDDLSEEEEPLPQTTQVEQRKAPKLPASRYDRKPLTRNPSRTSDAGTIPMVLDVRTHGRPTPNVTQQPTFNGIMSPTPPRSNEDDTGRSIRSRALSVRSKQSHASTFKAVDLKMESVLALSSSSDEDEDSDSDHKEPLRSPILRDSILVNPYRDSDVEVGTAQVVQAFSPSTHATSKRSSPPAPLKTISRFSGVTSPASSQLSPPVPQRHSSRLQKPFNPRSSVTSEKAVEQRISVVSSSTSNDDMSLGVPGFSGAGDLPGLERKPSTRVMRVTRQEESLLAAMRLKKANMRRAILTEAYHTAVEEEEEAAVALTTAMGRRPRTSGETRTSVDDSILDFEKHAMPPMPRPRTSEGRSSMGPGDFATLRGLVPPAPPSSYYQSQSDAANSSRRGSMIPSDSLPSPSTSRASPVTPTISHIPPVLPVVPIPSPRISDAYLRQFPTPILEEERPLQRLSQRKRSTPSMKSDKPRHSKPIIQETPHVRTILDDLDDAAEEAVNLDDFPMWAKGWTGGRQVTGEVTVVR